jgi:ankyrin repeat protein
MVSLLLNHKPKLNQSGGESSTTSLMEAARNGHIDIVQLLCDEGAVLDVVDLDGNTAILHAAKNKHIEIISYLLGKGARSDVHNKDGDSLASLKCRGEFTRLIEVYKEMLANNEHRRAILMSSSKKDFAICRGFIRAKISPNVIDENRKSVWYYVCLHNCTMTAKRLKSVRANAQAYQNISPTAETIKHGNAEILGYLFECGANVGEIIGDNRDSLLHLAASYGHEDILNLLFEKGANVHARNLNNESIWDVSKYRTRGLIKEKMENTRKNETEMMRRKLSKLANEQNWRELTSLITSHRRENKIEKTLQPPDGDGKTCLWWSAYYGSLETTRFIVSLIKNFDFLKIIDAVGSKDFTTPLWIGAKQGHYEVVKLLHLNGSNINAKDIYGNTPLHMATKNCHHKVMSYLVSAGADFDCKNNSGYTAIDMTGFMHYQTKTVLSSLIDAEIMRKEKLSNRRRSAEDTSTSYFVLRNSLERLQRSPGENPLVAVEIIP